MLVHAVCDPHRSAWRALVDSNSRFETRTDARTAWPNRTRPEPRDALPRLPVGSHLRDDLRDRRRVPRRPGSRDPGSTSATGAGAREHACLGRHRMRSRVRHSTGRPAQTGRPTRAPRRMIRPYTHSAAPVAVRSWGEPPSSSGLGRRPFKAEARVRIPLGARRLGVAALAPQQGKLNMCACRGVRPSSPPCQGGNRGIEARQAR